MSMKYGKQNMEIFLWNHLYGLMSQALMITQTSVTMDEQCLVVPVFGETFLFVEKGFLCCQPSLWMVFLHLISLRAQSQKTALFILSEKGCEFDIIS